MGLHPHDPVDIRPSSRRDVGKHGRHPLPGVAQRARDVAAVDGELEPLQREAFARSLSASAISRCSSARIDLGEMGEVANRQAVASVHRKARLGRSGGKILVRLELGETLAKKPD
jgi:hypothetical protein